MVAHGEVWWYEHPDRNPRPHLILTRDAAITVLHQLLAVPATRTVRGIPTEVPLDESDGMPAPCALTLDNATLVRTAFLTRRITDLGPERMREVCHALAVATAC
ncbi:MAG: type II toxin-antitoxin system PemK/MazF family toxin [Egibacteraceae bacterium]